VTLWGTGKPKREFLFVDDLARAVFYLLNLKKNKKIFKNFPIINIGSGEEISIKNLAYKLSRIFKKKIIIRKTSLTKGSTKARVPNINKIKKLGFVPKFNLDKGLKKTLGYNYF